MSDSGAMRTQKLLQTKSQQFCEKVDKIYLQKRFADHRIERKSWWKCFKDWLHRK